MPAIISLIGTAISIGKQKQYLNQETVAQQALKQLGIQRLLIFAHCLSVQRDTLWSKLEIEETASPDAGSHVVFISQWDTFHEGCRHSPCRSAYILWPKSLFVFL